MKPPHSGRQGGSGRPPSDRGGGPGGASRHPGQPNDRQQRRDHSGQGGQNTQCQPLRARTAPKGQHAPRQDGPRPQGKPFQNRPQDSQHRDRPRNEFRPDRQRDHARQPPRTPRAAPSGSTACTRSPLRWPIRPAASAI